MDLVDKYISYVRNERRYSERTVSIYTDVLRRFFTFCLAEEQERHEFSDKDVIGELTVQRIRSYEIDLLDMWKLNSSTVRLHMSVLSGFCRFLIKRGYLKSNPVTLVQKPKMSRHLPVFYKKEAMDSYMQATEPCVSEEDLDCFMASPDSKTGKQSYEKRLSRLIVSMLYGLGLRRAELMSLNIEDVDFGRNVVKVRGKGDKMREIPIIGTICEEILLYLKAVEVLVACKRSLKEPLLLTYTGKRLYPGYVDKVVKKELSSVSGITGRKSPHVLRHTLATQLLDNEADLNSIKELLGHSSLAATQVYTHNSVAKLKSIYKSAHPRAKNGGKHGD